MRTSDNQIWRVMSKIIYCHNHGKEKAMYIDKESIKPTPLCESCADYIFIERVSFSTPYESEGLHKIEEQENHDKM